MDCTDYGVWQLLSQGKASLEESISITIPNYLESRYTIIRNLDTLWFREFTGLCGRSPILSAIANLIESVGTSEHAADHSIVAIQSVGRNWLRTAIAGIEKSVHTGVTLSGFWRTFTRFSGP